MVTDLRAISLEMYFYNIIAVIFNVTIVYDNIKPKDNV